MEILFIYTEISYTDKQHYYSGLGSIIALLESKGHVCKLLCVFDSPIKEKFLNDISVLSFDLIGITTNWTQWQYVKKIASWIKQYKDVPIICGGCMPTLEPEKVISDASFDMVCIGEGEYPMLNLADKMDRLEMIDDIENLWIKKGDAIIKNPLRPLIHNLDLLPFPSRSHFDFQRLLNKTEYSATISSGRGCYNNCAFCINASYKSLYRNEHLFVRKHSPEYVIKEIKSLTERYEVKRIFFEDEDFVYNRKWINEFCDLYTKEVNIPFMIGYSISRAKEDILKLLKKAGCEWVGYGVETGNEFLRMHALNKRISNKNVIEKCRMTKKIGIKIICTIMVGVPFETEETVQETIDFLAKIRPHQILPMVYFPIPKTQLYETCKTENLISERAADYMTKGTSILNLPGISASRLDELYHTVNVVALSTLIDEVYSGYSSFADKFQKNPYTAGSNEIYVTIDWWKNIFDNHPIIMFQKSGQVTIPLEIKPQSVFRFGIGFQRSDNAMIYNGSIEFSINIYTDNHETSFSHLIDLDNHLNRNLHYQFHDISLAEHSDPSAKVQITVNRDHLNEAINTFFINPFLDRI